MKKRTIAIAAALFIVLLVWAFLAKNNVPPDGDPQDNSLNQPGAVGDQENGQNAAKGDLEDVRPQEDGEHGVYPGDRAYVFELMDLEGNSVSLSHLRDRVVLVCFWQTTCSWCQEELPILDELYKVYKDDGLVVLAINIAEEREVVAQMVEEKGLTFPVLLDQEAEVAKKYLVSYLPTNYIINPKGNISAMHIGHMEYQQMEDYIETAFREDR